MLYRSKSAKNVKSAVGPRVPAGPDPAPPRIHNSGPPRPTLDRSSYGRHTIRTRKPEGENRYTESRAESRAFAVASNLESAFPDPAASATQVVSPLHAMGILDGGLHFYGGQRTALARAGEVSVFIKVT